jgi:UDP-N-acetylmuramyl pentapeptide phosphotransferase/UDP-N-acetylglucosamine-1-phosphate transferase
MRLGPLEIVLIIAVIIAMALIARIVRMGRRTAAKDEKSQSSQMPTASQPETKAGRGSVNRAGIVLIIAGIIALIAAASLFRLILQGYLWALLLIAVGFILVRLSRKKG